MDMDLIVNWFMMIAGIYLMVRGVVGIVRYLVKKI